MRSSTHSLRLHVESALAGRVASPFRFREPAAPLVVPTSIPALDESVGGLPRGALTEIYGPPCSGKTSILHSALASRTQSEACALVDAQDAFDPSSAQASGVYLPRLLWARCRGLEQAFRCLDLLLHGGGFGLITLDIADAPARLVRKVPLNVWFRLRRAVEETPTVLLVLSRESNAKTCASLVLRLEQETTQWSLRTSQSLPCIPHTPGCFLDGSAHSAEIVRSPVRLKKPLFINQSTSTNSEDKVLFQMNSDQFDMQEVLLQPQNELNGQQEQQEQERMQNPG
jgi:recombination protein RecA